MSRKLPGQETLTMTGEVTDKEVAEAVMAVEEEATVVNTAAALMTGSGPNTVRLQGSSTGSLLKTCRPGQAPKT